MSECMNVLCAREARIVPGARELVSANNAIMLETGIAPIAMALVVLEECLKAILEQLVQLVQGRALYLAIVVPVGG